MAIQILEFQEVPKEIKKQRVRRRILLLFPYYQLIAFILVLAGCLSWFFLPLLTKHTYVSENALLPGQSNSKFNQFDLINEYHKQIKGNVTLQQVYSLISDNKLHKLHALHPQYFLLKAVSPRGDGSESILLYSTIQSPYACALLLAYYKDIQSRNYLAKDLLILITDKEPTGTHEFVKEWYNSNNNIIWNRPGEIQVALGIMMDSPTFNTFNVRFTGHNPRLPNLDVINTITRISTMYNLRLSVHNYQAVGMNTFVDSLRRMAAMMFDLIIGDPTYSPHSNFANVGLDAVTIHCTNMSSVLYGVHNDAIYNIKHASLLIDLTSRSFNNLLEKFHQSFYFYILDSPTSYISIIYMIIPIALLLSALLITAIATWYYSDVTTVQKYIPNHTSKSRPVLNVIKCLMVPLSNTVALFALISVLKSAIPDNILFVVHIVGSMMIHVIYILKSQDILELVLADINIPSMQQQYWLMMKCTICVYMICFIIGTGTFNYYSSAVLTTLIVPIVIYVGPPSSNNHLQSMNLILLLMSASGLFITTQSLQMINWKWINGILELVGANLDIYMDVDIPVLWLGLFKKWFKFGNPFYPFLTVGYQAAILGCVMIVNGFEFNMV